MIMDFHTNTDTDVNMDIDMEMGMDNDMDTMTDPPMIKCNRVMLTPRS
jgi:hypothetical protein